MLSIQGETALESSSIWTKFLELAPRTIEIVDFEGNKRRFKLGGSERELFGFDIFATEEGRPDDGYYFKAFSHSSPHEALTQLVNKMRTELSVRHLEPSSESVPPSLMCHKAKGRVTAGGVVIDGKLIYWPDFVRMAAAYEGWEFNIEFSS
jgi:hypothetical protein